MSDFLSDASASAMADVQAYADPTPAVDTSTEPTVSPEAEAPPSTPAPFESGAASPATPVPGETPAEQAARLFTLRYRGQELPKTEEETIALAQMGFDYTQKAQALAEQLRLVQEREQTVAHQAQELESVLKDETRLKQLVMWAAQQQGVELPDPNEILTQSQVQQLLKEKIDERVAQVEQETKKEIARTHFALETNRQEVEFKAAFTNHVASLVEKHPLLKEDPHVSDDLRQYGAAYLQQRLQTEGPLARVDQTDVFKAISQEANRRAVKEQGRIDNHVKAHLARSREVVAKGTEPTGGTPPSPAPARPFKLGSKELRDQVLADLTRGD